MTTEYSRGSEWRKCDLKYLLMLGCNEANEIDNEIKGSYQQQMIKTTSLVK